MLDDASRMHTALRRMSLDELAALLVDVPGLADAAEGRGPLAPGWPWATARRSQPGLANLARLLASPAGFDLNLAGLDRFTLQLAQLALWHGGGLRREQALFDTAGAHGPELDEAARRLQRRQLAEAGDGWLTLKPQAADMLGIPGMSARDWFVHDTSDVLAAMLGKLGVRSVPTRKHERLDALVAALRDRQVVTDTIAAMPDDVRRVFTLLCRHGPHKLPDLGIPYLASYSFHRREATPVDWLRERGLVGVDHEQQVCFVWLDVIVALSEGRLFAAWEPEAPAAPPKPLTEGPVRVPPAVERLAALLELWAAEPADALAGGGLGVRPIRAAAKRLGLDPGEVGLLAHLAVGLGLLGTVAVGTKGRGRKATTVRQWSPTPLFHDWLGEPAARRWAHMVQAWRDDPYHDEVDGLPDRRDGPHPSGPTVAPTLARAALLGLLADLPVGHGLDSDHLVAVSSWHRPYLLPSARTPGLVAAARALGLVPASGPVGLTTAGRALLAGPDALAETLPPGRREFVVQADLTVITPPDADPDLCAELARLADCESDAGARIWRLSEQRIIAALDAGADPDEITAFLSAHASADLPQNVAYLLADVVRRHGRTRAGSASSYLRSDDAALLGQALAVKAAKLRPLAPTVAVSSLPRTKLVAALRDRSVSVVPEDADGAAVVDTESTPEPAAVGALPPLHDPVGPGVLAARLLGAASGDSDQRGLGPAGLGAASGDPGRLPLEERT